jgi:hypothetical protein
MRRFEDGKRHASNRPAGAPPEDCRHDSVRILDAQPAAILDHRAIGSEGSDGDKAAMEALSGLSYAEVTRELAPLQLL